MRVSLKIFLTFLLLATHFASASSKDFIERGADFYSRGDYASARELFKQVKLDGSAESGIASFFLGAIDAYEGSITAFEKLEYAIKNAPEPIKIQALEQYAKVAILNDKSQEAEKIFAKYAPKEPPSSMFAWLYASILWNVGKKQEALTLWCDTLQKDFSNPTAFGVDAFIDAYLSGDEFAKAVKIDLSATTPVGVSRLEMLEGKPITPAFNELTLLGQIEKIDSQGGSSAEFDVALLADSLRKNSRVPYAWRAALIISEKYFALKNYSEALKYATTAQFLAPPEMEYQWRPLIAEGDACRLMKKYSDAESAYLKVAMAKRFKGEPVAEALYKTGLCWFEQGDWAKAHAYFERVYIAYFKFEYWGSRAYYYAAQSLFSLKLRRDANATLVEYFRRAKDRQSEIYKAARAYYDKI